MTTTPDRPKGAGTGTAAQSKKAFLVYIALTVVVLPVLVLGMDGNGRWLRLAVFLLFAVLAVLSFRSWRILKRFEAQQ